MSVKTHPLRSVGQLIAKVTPVAFVDHELLLITRLPPVIGAILFIVILPSALCTPRRFLYLAYIVVVFSVIRIPVHQNVCRLPPAQILYSIVFSVSTTSSISIEVLQDCEFKKLDTLVVDPVENV